MANSGRKIRSLKIFGDVTGFRKKVIMQVGEVRVAEDTDYAYFKSVCKCHDEWNSVYNKNGTSVWTKQNDLSDFKMIKVKFT